MEGAATFVTLLCFCMAVMVSDIRSRKVPNTLNILGFAAGITVGLLEGGALQLINSTLGTLLGLGILLIPFLLRMVGGGDVKFFASAGAISGWRVLGISFLVGAAIGGILGIMAIVIRPRSRNRIINQLVALSAPGSLIKPVEKPGVKSGSEFRLPYAVPLSLGLILCSGLQLLG
ncbi:MAG: prepilin peptidase [Actinobacteria bacterium]|nr:prepilin peptidase [Actinomycetota bacterium]